MTTEAAHTWGAIPADLRQQRRWVMWKRELVDGKPKKTPYTVDLRRRASSTDPATWASFDEALVVVTKGRADGIGYALPDRELVLVDLDDAMNGDGTLHPEAAAIILHLDTYSEWSQSGEGIHCVLRGKLSGNRHQARAPWGGKFETWDHARFVYLTGAIANDAPATINKRQEQLDRVVARYLPETPKKHEPARAVEPVSDDDRVLLDRAFAAANGRDVRALYGGGWQARYRSQSEADLALVGALSFWTGPDEHRLDSLFRRSGLMRRKWDAKLGETTYGGTTIA